MNILILVELWEKAKPYINHLGYPVALVFAFLWWNKTTPCPVAEPIVVTQAQTSKSDCTGKVKYIPQPYVVEVPGEAPKPLPCPAIEIDFSAGSSQAHWQSVSQTPQDAPKHFQEPLGLFVGAGYLGTPIATLGLYRGPWRVGALGSLGQVGGLASYDFKF